jgi:ankyrin repeat protein
MTRSRALCGLVALLATAGVSAAPNSATLLDAVTKADHEAVRALVKAGANVNVTAPDGSTALHWAVNKNDLESVQLLLKAGARSDATNRYGVTPIALAAENGDASMILVLLKAGASATARQADGDTPIMIAARTGAPDALKALMVHGASPNATNKRGQTPLMWAAARNNSAAVSVLLEAGARIDARTTDGVDKPKLAETSENQYETTITAPPPTGFTPLLFAVRAGSLDAVRLLVSAGADVNDTLSDGESALVVATANAHWGVADFLLDRGADPNRAEAGWNALHQAVRIRRPNIGFGFPGPLPTGTIDNIDVIKKMIAKGAKVDARMTKNGMKDGQRNRLIRTGATPFFLAAKNTDTEVMKLLLASGADARIPNGELTTPLMVAAGLHIWNPGEDGGSLPGQEDEVLEAVKLCVDNGNDVKAANHQGWTALHGAAFRGVNSIAEYLVEKGAPLDARTVQGWTAWSIANGLTYSEFYKNQPHTATLLAKMMQERGLSTEGQVVDPKVCLDCVRAADAMKDLREREKFALEQMAASKPVEKGVP